MSGNNISNFIHLRTQSNYSLGKSVVRIKELVDIALKHKMPALCIADHGNLFGSLEFAMAAVKSGLQPIIGCIIKIQSELVENLYSDYFIIAKNEVGYKNLLKLVSHSFLYNSVPEVHITLDSLLESKEGLILLCGGMKSEIQELLIKKNLRAAKNLISKLHKNFQDNFFIELQRYQDKRESDLENFLLDIAYSLDIPIVATNNVTHITQDMREALDALMCIIQGRYMVEENRETAKKDEYFKTPKEMWELFFDLPEAINNTLLIAKKCSFFPEERAVPLLPKFSEFTENITDEVEEFERYAYLGLEQRLLSVKDADVSQYYDRLKFEMAMINKMNFPGYFLIVADFINWSKKQGVPVGPGRGSGVGSIVAWSLGITELDPIKFNLLFERFLNPERVSMPDFDIDFCQERRDEVIEYVRKKYGEDKVAQIITFGKLQARAALRDVGRVLQLPYGLIDSICKMVPHNPANPITLKEAIELDKELPRMQEQNQEIGKLLDISLKLEGINRHVSTHAAGIVITDRPIIELVPLYQDNNSSMPAVQYSMKYAEAAGLMKFDFLGLKTLTVIAETVKLIKKNRNIEIDIAKLSLDDVAVYEMLSRGDVMGVFQFEGAGMKEAIKQLKPDCINDLIALSSLYRPGPMENIPSYISRKHGKSTIDYIHPLLEGVLKETYGIIVYQEQVMQIAQILAGYSLGEADILRRAMGKKNKEEMRSQRSIFIEKSHQRGLDKDRAGEIFDYVDKFASYGFNKSHAAAYSIISYQTAYLKAHYTIEFLTASINLEINDSDKISLFCHEASRWDIKILPPCINKSREYCIIEGSNIRFGLAAIKSVGLKLMQNVVQERDDSGFFKDIWDFLERCSKISINKKAIENLAKSGAFSSIHRNRKQLAESLDTLMLYINQNEVNLKQTNLFFDSDQQGDNNKLTLKEVEDFSYHAVLDLEFESLGVYISAHPINRYIEHLRDVTFADAIHSLNNIKTAVVGVIMAKRIRSSKRGKYAFLQISDHTGLIEMGIFNENILYENSKLLDVGKLIFAFVDIKRDANGLRVVVEKISDLENAINTIVPGCYELYISNIDALAIIKSKLNNSNYGCNVRLVAAFNNGHSKHNVYFNGPNLRIPLSDIEELKKYENIKVVAI